MAVYRYRAKDGPGRTVEGEVEAASEAGALARLDDMGYIPVWVRERDASPETGTPSGRGIRGREVTVFTRQLASLLRAGVPILKALDTIRDQTEGRRMRVLLAGLERIVRDGNMLSAALQRFPALFPALYVSMVRSGESAGALDTILTRLADAREHEEDLRRKVQAAVAYPLLVLVVGALTVGVLFTFFLPRVVGLFEGYDALPLATRILIAVSDFSSVYGYAFALAALLAAAVFRGLLRLDRGRSLLDGLKLRVPLLGPALRQADIARFARTLALLIESGVTIDRALRLSADTLRNTVLREAVEEVRGQTVSQGMPVSQGLKRHAVFPPMVANMAAVGEQAGRLDGAMSEVALFYEKEVEQTSRLAVSLLEPALILAVGGIVGFIVAAMLLPIFELGTAF